MTRGESRTAFGTATKETMPLFAWTHHAIVLSGATEADTERYVTRERLQRWYRAGESVGGAADMISTWVRLAKRSERGDRVAPRPGDILRAQLRAGAKARR